MEPNAYLQASSENTGESQYIAPAATGAEDSLVRQAEELALFSCVDGITDGQTGVRTNHGKIFTSNSNHSTGNKNSD